MRLIFDFWTTYGGKMGVATTRGLMTRVWPLNFYELFFENPNSKVSAKFSSTFILKISRRNIEKCKSLSVLNDRVLRKNANGDMATFVHFKRFFGLSLDILAYIELQISQNM